MSVVSSYVASKFSPESTDLDHAVWLANYTPGAGILCGVSKIALVHNLQQHRSITPS